VELLLVLCLPRDAETAHVTREVLNASLTVLGVAAEIRDDVTLALGERARTSSSTPTPAMSMRFGSG
jgi:hypothetical protein